MKNILIIVYMLAIMLSSCTTDNEDNSIKEQQRVQISFAPPVIYGISRAGTYTGPIYGEMDADGSGYSKDERFLVYGKKYSTASGGTWQGWANAENVFDAESEEFSYIGGTAANGWFTTRPYYFDEGYNYCFAAISPSIITNKTTGPGSYASSVAYNSTSPDGNGTADGFVITNYVPGELGQQLDLLYAPRMYDINGSTKTNQGAGGNTNAHYNGVNLKFRHALSSIHFKVCIDPEFYNTYNASYGSKSEEYKIKDGDFVINSIKLKKVVSKATFNQNIKAADDKLKKDTENTAAWTLSKTAADKIEYVFLSTPQNLPLPTQTETTVADAAKDVTTYSGHYGLLIPQRTAKIMVEINWTYKWREKNPSAAGTIEKNVTNTTNINLKDYTPKWEMGKRYIYTIAFKGSMIRFAPDVEVWGYNDVENI